MSDETAATALRRALLRSAAAIGVAIEIEQDDYTRWASATFDGGLHLLSVNAESSDALDRWLAGLANLELQIAGHLVADLVEVSVSRSAGRTVVLIEAITVQYEAAA